MGNADQKLALPQCTQTLQGKGRNVLVAVQGYKKTRARSHSTFILNTAASKKISITAHPSRLWAVNAKPIVQIDAPATAAAM